MRPPVGSQRHAEAPIVPWHGHQGVAASAASIAQGPDRRALHAPPRPPPHAGAPLQVVRDPGAPMRCFTYMTRASDTIAALAWQLGVPAAAVLRDNAPLKLSANTRAAIKPHTPLRLCGVPAAKQASQLRVLSVTYDQVTPSGYPYRRVDTGLATYWVVPMPVTQPQAATFCAAYGGALAPLRSRQESAEVTAAVVSTMMLAQVRGARVAAAQGHGAEGTAQPVGRARQHRGSPAGDAHWCACMPTLLPPPPTPAAPSLLRWTCGWACSGQPTAGHGAGRRKAPARNPPRKARRRPNPPPRPPRAQLHPPPRRAARRRRPGQIGRPAAPAWRSPRSRAARCA